MKPIIRVIKLFMFLMKLPRYIRFLWGTCLLFSGALYAVLEEDAIARRVHAHMIIADYSEASIEGYAGLQRFPQSKAIWHAYLRSLAKASDEKTLMANWRSFVERFPEESTNREILECLAWCVLEKGAASSSPAIRVTAMLGAFFSQDAKGIAMLRKGLSDNNSFVRSASLKLASMTQDPMLHDEILRLMRTENVWSVRMGAIQAAGALGIKEARPALLAIISKQQSRAEEKAVAIEALVAMTDKVDAKQIYRLVCSDRAGLRLLACELLAAFDEKRHVDYLLPLVKDCHADVRAKALHTIGYLRANTVGGQPATLLAEEGLQDSDPIVVVTAAWLLILNDRDKGQKAFASLLEHEHIEVQRQAAAALAAAGKYSLPLMKEAFKRSQDPYVRMNLAIGLIGQQTETMGACDCLYTALSELKERWSWDEDCDFQTITVSQAKHDDAIPNHPEALNQISRLKVLEVLAILHYPHAQQAIKSFLQEQRWGISGMASALLLTEGDEDAVELVKELLQDSDQNVKVQAALILALWGRGEDSVNFLQEAYTSADRELKGQILEGVGRVGSTFSMPFLVERLQESYQTTRIIAAAALLDCLYN